MSPYIDEAHRHRRSQRVIRWIMFAIIWITVAGITAAIAGHLHARTAAELAAPGHCFSTGC